MAKLINRNHTIFNRYHTSIFRAYNSYLAVTGHYISKNWELKRFLVSLTEARDKHTSDMIAIELDEIIGDLEIPVQ